MKLILLIILLAASFTCIIGQIDADTVRVREDEIRLRKQIIVDETETQAKELQFAALRTLIRYKVALWLWKGGNDVTDRAETITVIAINDLYENRAEVSELYFGTLRTDLFVLLEKHNLPLAKKLEAKYEISHEETLRDANSMLNLKGGEKLAADKIIETLEREGGLNTTATWVIAELEKRNSPELLRILDHLLIDSQKVGGGFSSESLFYLVDIFRSEMIPRDLKQRFYGIVMSNARSAIGGASDEIMPAYDLLTSVLKDFAANAPSLLPEANSLAAIMSAKVPQSVKLSEEIYKRVDESADRLEALIAEAEKVDDLPLKQGLFTDAARLALKKRKFLLAVDLVVKILEQSKSQKDKREKFSFQRWRDQFLGEIVEGALKAHDLDSARYAIKHIEDKIVVSDALKKMSIYYIENQNMTMADESVSDALRNLVNEPNDSKKVNSLLRFIPIAQKINSNCLSEVTGASAKNLNAIASLNADDKPNTENYKNYASLMMAIAYNLFPVMNDLAIKNLTEATNFSSRINKKEIKIFSDFVLSAKSIEMLKK